MSTEKDKLINHEDGLNIISALQMIKSSYGQYFKKPYLIDSTIPYEEGVTANILDHLIGFDSDRMLIYGDVTASEKSKNICYITLKSMNDRWLDGSEEKFEIEWNYGNPFDPTILTKDTVTFDELLSVIDQENSSYRTQMVGKLVTGLTNSLYSGSYRIIGKDHDSSSNTFDLLTEDCVQQASSGFGSSNRHYDDSGCLARIFAEETFYNAFDSTIKEHIKPMNVDYRYSTSTTTGSTGTLRTLTNKYGKLLSYNEVGTTYASTTSQGDKYKYADAGSEGTVYEYFNLTGSTLSNIRIKKYNGSAVNWWLRSRYTISASGVGYIYTDGTAYGNGYNFTGYYLAPVIRIG